MSRQNAATKRLHEDETARKDDDTAATMTRRSLMRSIVALLFVFNNVTAFQRGLLSTWVNDDLPLRLHRLHRRGLSEESYHYDYDTRPISSTISLTKEEQDLFHLIKQVRDRYRPNTTIRVAGGWVRDKLLLKATSHDIDIVLSDTSGSDFCKLFQQYVIENNLENDVFLVTSAGGARSMHLKTASIQFRDFEIDFCQLRFEKYAADSRVPETTLMAPPVQDAWRRDFTINSLFYNVNTNQVEDWTEQGLQDMQLGIIATPVDSLATLLEDPLRALRAIRFATQLEFVVDASLKRASTDRRVRLALERKVSKDRIGNEMDIIFSSRDPARGAKLLLDTNLVAAAFRLDGKEELEGPSVVLYEAGNRLLSRTQALVSKIFVHKSQWDETRRRYLWYAAFLKPICDSKPLDVQSNSKRSRRDGSVLYQLLTRGLNRPARDTQSIERIIQGVYKLQTFLEKYGEPAMQLGTNDAVASFEDDDPQWKQIADIRWRSYKVFKEIGSLWKESLILLLAINEREVIEAVEQYKQWMAFFDLLGLNDSIFGATRLLLNGSQIQRALPGARGATFKQIMEAQEEWQVRHGCLGDAADNNSREADLIEYLVDKFPEYAGRER